MASSGPTPPHGGSHPSTGHSHSLVLQPRSRHRLPPGGLVWAAHPLWRRQLGSSDRFGSSPTPSQRTELLAAPKRHMPQRVPNGWLPPSRSITPDSQSGLHLPLHIVARGPWAAVLLRPGQPGLPKQQAEGLEERVVWQFNGWAADVPRSTRLPPGSLLPSLVLLSSDPLPSSPHTLPHPFIRGPPSPSLAAETPTSDPLPIRESIRLRWTR